jgi:ribose transport system permease protein
MWSRFLSDYGMVLILAALCAFLAIGTVGEQYPSGAAAGKQVADDVIARTPAGASVLIIVRDTPEDRAFQIALQERLTASGRHVVQSVYGEPSGGALAIRKLTEEGVKLNAIAVTKEVGEWSIFDQKTAAVLYQPVSRYGSTFLTAANLVNVADQIAVIAIMAIGMTMVIITGGIDLSVGSLVALSSVLSTWLIRASGGAGGATNFDMILGCAAAVGACGLVGLGTGVVVTGFRVPAFIVTLGVMQIARGAAARITEGQSIADAPESFTWLARGSTLGIPNAIGLMVVLYAIAHFVMARTVLGRYLYAVGGNAEAARLSGVPVPRVVAFSYAVSGALAGLGGVLVASQLRTGSPIYGEKYELLVIAAVVVGGTSLSGGEGKILGTLTGAFLIAVINNGMNLVGLQSWDQEMVLGGVIVLAVLFDRVKQLGWTRFSGA